MRRNEIDLVDVSLGVPTVPHDLSLKELKGVFEELCIYTFLTVLKGNVPIGVVYREQVKKLSDPALTAGELVRPLCRLRNTTITSDGLHGLLELLPLEREPVILTDRKGTYMGVLTYDTVLRYITHHKEYVLPIVQKLHSATGKKEFLCVFGLKNMEKFKELFGVEKADSVQRILEEDVKDLFGKSLSGVAEKGEVWVISREKPSEELIKELLKSFHKEYSLLFGEFQEVYIYGFCIDMSFVSSQEEFYSLKEKLKEKSMKIEGSVFILHGLQPTLVLHDPGKKMLITNIKRRILSDFKEIVETLRHAHDDSWEYVLYDSFGKYPYFELFYVISERGLQITNNVVNTKLDYFVAQGKKGADRSEKAYFREAIARGSYISDIYLSKATDDFCITVSEAFSYRGKTYVLAGDINFRQVCKLVKEYERSASHR